MNGYFTAQYFDEVKKNNNNLPPALKKASSFDKVKLAYIQIF